jgi:tRNA(fMet)-specific endonuclease VapC
MGFLLDTNIISAIVQQSGGRAEHRFLSQPIDDVFTSVICAAEIEFGVRNKPKFRTAARLQSFLAGLEILPFEMDAARTYGAIRCALRGAGTPVGANDLFIAAHALALDATLVTANEREFRRVPGLKVENWARA